MNGLGLMLGVIREKFLGVPLWLRLAALFMAGLMVGLML